MKRRVVLEWVAIAVLVVMVALAVFSPRFNWIIAYHGPIPRQVR